MKQKILLIICLLVFLFIACEVTVRIYQKIAKGTPFFNSVWNYYDKELGWKGKKVFGDIMTKKYKIFFVGDSFTEGCGVSESNMYYNIIAKNLDAEAFVYGGPGYGTLQEYMVINRYIDKIKPDLIVLQVCVNDFINNSWELESVSFINNNLLIRPYLVKGKIEYKFPRFPGKLGMILYSYSRLMYLLEYNFDRFLVELCKRGYLHTVEDDIEHKGIEFDNFKKAVNVTNDLVKMIKRRAGWVPIVAFSVSNYRNYPEQFRNIFQNNNIEFIEDVPNRISEAKLMGADVYLKNQSHWNSAGHLICGELLSERLRPRIIKEN